MVDIYQLLSQLETQEKKLLTRQFLAPCVLGGRIRTQLSGMVYTFRPQPRDFQGWGVFQPIAVKTAKLMKTANLQQIELYLQQFEVFRVLLVRVLQNQTWLAVPVNFSDMQQRLGWSKPIQVHLVGDGMAFETAIVRYDGHIFWFESSDRRADPLVSEALRQAFREGLLSKDLQFKGVTPEMRVAYDLATQELDEFSLVSRNEKRLRAALKMGGGELKDFRDRNDFWQVEWATPDGEVHSSAITKSDLTVMSAGICLDDRDRDFDLQSLVGVIEGQDKEWD